MTDTKPCNPPAFPYSALQPDPETRQLVGTMYADNQGMTLRDYFMAHAPAEPQPWFVPVMPPKPEIPDPDKELSAEDAAEWRRLDDFASEEGNEQVKAFCERQGIVWDERYAWDKERDKQRYIQWPAAWADAMLRARAA